MERSIIFSTPMVQAILDGRKTQTRRIIKGDIEVLKFTDGQGYFATKRNKKGIATFYKCPYGTPGDLLWVRETWMKIPFFPNTQVYYKASVSQQFLDEWPTWKPSIFMPKDAARIWLRITYVRIERLNDISLLDIRSEGLPSNWKDIFSSPYEWWQQLWQSINTKHKTPNTEQNNPWVWVISFKVLSTTGKPFNPSTHQSSNPSTLDSASAAKQPKPFNS